MMKITVDPKMTIELPETFRPFIQRMRQEGKRIVIEVSEEEELRSKEQNAKYRVMLRRLSQFSGSDTDYLDGFVKQKAIDMGYPYVIGENGEITPKPSHLVSVREMMVLIEAIISVGLENGIDLEEH